MNSRFDRWLERVDRIIARVAFGLSHEDLADMAWRDWFDAGMSPADAATLALLEEGFPF